MHILQKASKITIDHTKEQFISLNWDGAEIEPYSIAGETFFKAYVPSITIHGTWGSQESFFLRIGYTEFTRHFRVLEKWMLDAVELKNAGEEHISPNCLFEEFYNDEIPMKERELMVWHVDSDWYSELVDYDPTLDHIEKTAMTQLMDYVTTGLAASPPGEYPDFHMFSTHVGKIFKNV